MELRSDLFSLPYMLTEIFSVMTSGTSATTPSFWMNASHG